MAYIINRLALWTTATYIFNVPTQPVDLCEQICLFLRRLIEIEPRVVGHNEREVGGDGKDIAERPSFEEVERDVGVELEEGLKRDEALLELFVGVPVRLVQKAGFGPAIEEVLHRIHGAADTVIGDVDYVIDEEMWREREDFWN